MDIFSGSLNDARITETVKAYSVTKDNYMNSFFWSDVLRRYYLHYKLTKDANYKITIYDIVNYPASVLKSELIPALEKLQPDLDGRKAIALYRALLEKMQAIHDNPTMTAEEYFKLSITLPDVSYSLDLTGYAEKIDIIEDDVDKCLDVMYGSHGLDFVVTDTMK